MIEIPEAAVLVRQLSDSVRGKTVLRATAGQHPHKFAWYSGDPAGYSDILPGRVIGKARAFGGKVEILASGLVLVFAEGINLRFHPGPEGWPKKHQLLIEFEDGSALSASISMYGGLWCDEDGASSNPYVQVAREKPSPLSGDFTPEYFLSLFQPELEKLSLKAFLATQQRIPGLGNGTLQDILFRARLHPKSPVSTLDGQAREQLYQSICATLQEMADCGGRDTEADLYGQPGGYRTRMSKNTAGQPCAECGSTIQKQSFLGGSIYFCPTCQPVLK